MPADPADTGYPVADDRRTAARLAFARRRARDRRVRGDTHPAVRPGQSRRDDARSRDGGRVDRPEHRATDDRRSFALADHIGRPVRRCRLAGSVPIGLVVGSGGVPTASSSAEPVLVGAGDIADCALDDDSATADLVATIPGTVFTAGDNAYPNGTADQFRDCYGPTWGRFLDRTRPAAGNHDWETKDLAGYVGYFGTAAEPKGVSWYSYDLGTWHVVVLDSDCSSVGGCGADSVQGRWLTADLAASTARCTLAIWHHPRFSSGEHGNDTDVAPFWQRPL